MSDIIEQSCCGTTDPDAITKARTRIPAREELETSAAFFSALSDPSRLAILHALSGSPLCVCDLAALLGASQSAASHQLRVLRDRRLVRAMREGKAVRYSLHDEHVSSIIDQAAGHGREKE